MTAPMKWVGGFPRGCHERFHVNTEVGDIFVKQLDSTRPQKLWMLSRPGTWDQSTLPCSWHMHPGEFLPFPEIGSTFVCCSNWGALTPSPPAWFLDILQDLIWLLPPQCPWRVTRLSAPSCISINLCHVDFPDALLQFVCLFSLPTPPPCCEHLSLFVSVFPAWHRVRVQESALGRTDPTLKLSLFPHLSLVLLSSPDLVKWEKRRGDSVIMCMFAIRTCGSCHDFCPLIIVWTYLVARVFWALACGGHCWGWPDLQSWLT